jgi:hypothetical protein
MSVSAARSRVMQAQTLIEVRRYDEVESVVETGLGFLVGLPEAETAEIATQLVALRAEAAALYVAEQFAAKIRAAQRELNAAKEDIEKGYVMSSGIDFRFDKAAEYLDGVPAELKAPLLDQAEMLRAILIARDGGVPAAPAESGAPAGPVLSADEQANLSKARGRINQVRALVETRRTEGADGLLDEAGTLLAGVAESERTPLLADIEALRAELVTVEQAEYARKVDSEFSPHLYDAENVKTWEPDHSARALAHLTERIAEEKQRGALSTQTLAAYEERVVAATATRTALLKADALERGLPLLAELEARVVTDPFEGLDQSGAYRATQEMETLRYRALHEVRNQPADDPDVVAFNARVDAVNSAIERASQKWSTAQLHEQVRRSWEIVEQSAEIAGWREESGAAEPRLLEIPDLPRTRTAIMRIGYLLADTDTVQVRADHAGDEVVRSTYRAAEEERSAAVAKLAREYHAVLALAERAETPMRSDDLNKTGHFSVAVRSSFEDTAALGELLDRTAALEERWRAEVAAIMQARQDLYDRLAAQAAADWPAIVAATGAGTDFDPGDTGAGGRVVHLEGVYNRAGWDFQNFDFCMRWDGIPLGGSYEPYVLQALEHAWYELKLDVNDRIAWDVVAVVQGPGKIGERTQISVRGSNGLEIGKVEEWPAVECVRLKIIALHAGPVAVGPDHAWSPTP